MTPQIEFNPATLMLIALLGGIFGAIGSLSTYISYEVAQDMGENIAPKEARIRLPLPSEATRPPLPHELIMLMFRR